MVPALCEVPEGEAVTSGPELLGAEACGIAELGSCCFCLVAGGLGERLGYPGIKVGIVADPASGRCFLEVYIEAIRALEAKTGKQLPLAIMTSDDTHVATEELLRANGFFGLQEDQVTLMKQAKVPALADRAGNMSCDADGGLATKPHGHGDVHSLLYSSGLASKWKAEGRKWLLFFQAREGLAGSLIISPMCDRSKE